MHFYLIAPVSGQRGWIHYSYPDCLKLKDLGFVSLRGLEEIGVRLQNVIQLGWDKYCISRQLKPGGSPACISARC